MEKKIPLYFDSVIIDSPFQEVSNNPRIGRLKVRVFTKYGNRNGSYITEAVANQLIETATKGTTPVVGFFDPETKSWASHTGPTLANAYGYVENFIGWEPFTDTDGILRDYAVFSVILFTDYFEEANKIFGQNQSMELDPASITGDWANIEGQEFYVYKTAKMLGFCIIGEHEPCFSVSSFFAKNDENYDSQYEKISSLLFNLKTQVEEAEKNQKGGEQPMEEFKNQEIVEEKIEGDPQDTFRIEENETTEETESTAKTETVVENEDITTEEDSTSEFENLQQQFNELQNSYNELQSNYETAQAQLEEFKQNQDSLNEELNSLRTSNEQLQSNLQEYIKNAEKDKKNILIEKYEKIMSAEEIDKIKEEYNDFSYEELESKLAITFANSKIKDENDKKVPLVEPESQFAQFMKKYRKD